jgi:hypothetical protein
VTSTIGILACRSAAGGSRFSIGVDLGQRRDPSAVAVVERLRTSPQFDPATWSMCQPESEPRLVIRHLERIPLGTPYTEVAARIVHLARQPEIAGACRLVVDATGVGMPVLDMLRAAAPGCPIAPVLITGGQSARFDGKIWYVPKMELMARLQSLFESKQLAISGRLRESPALVRELLDIRTAHIPSGRARAGAEGANQHDDLAMAVALALWPKPAPLGGHQAHRLPGI